MKRESWERGGKKERKKAKGYHQEQQLTRRVVGRVIRGVTIRRQPPVPRRRGLEIPHRLAAELRLYIRRGLDIERRLRCGKKLSIERGERSGGRLGLHVGLSLLAWLGPRRRERHRRWRRWHHGPEHPVVARRGSFARSPRRGSHLGGWRPSRRSRLCHST